MKKPIGSQFSFSNLDGARASISSEDRLSISFERQEAVEDGEEEEEIKEEKELNEEEKECDEWIEWDEWIAENEKKWAMKEEKEEEEEEEKNEKVVQLRSPEKLRRD